MSALQCSEASRVRPAELDGAVSRQAIRAGEAPRTHRSSRYTDLGFAIASRVATTAKSVVDGITPRTKLELLDWFVSCGYLRQVDPVRRANDGQLYKKGWEVRFTLETIVEAQTVRDLVLDPGLRPGLVFMTIHRPDQVETNVLTIDATDPRSGTAEFKAAAGRVDRLSAQP